MNWKKFVLEGIALVAAAVICALVSNGIAARERKLTLAGTYPNALQAPVQAVAATMAATTSGAPAPPPALDTTGIRTQSAGKGAGAPPKATKVAAPKPAPTPPAPAPLARFPSHPDKPYVEIGYADAKTLHDAGALVLDARRTSVYEQGHIAGARPFSVWESDVDQKMNRLFDERGDPRDQARPIVIYCSGGDCEDSHMLAQKLWGIQFNNVYVYKDGFPDWQAKGGAVRTGPNP